MSFGGLQKAVSKKCLRLMLEGNEKTSAKVLKEYIEYVKGREPLITQYHVFESIRNYTEPDKDLAIMFIKDTMTLVEDLNRGDILTFNNLLGHKFGVVEHRTALDDAIHVLIEDKVADFSYNRPYVSGAFKVVLEHVMSEKPSNSALDELSQKHNVFGDVNLEFFTPQKIMKMVTEKFNTEYGPLFTDAERDLFKVLQSMNTKVEMNAVYDIELAALTEDIEKFTHATPRLDTDIVDNLTLAEKKLRAADVDLDGLLNIFELRSQIRGLANEANDTSARR